MIKPEHTSQINSPVLTKGEWTKDSIANFWNYYAHRNDKADWYFSAYYSQAFVNLGLWTQSLKGNVLDYGSASGALLPALLKHSIKLNSLDFSSDSIDKHNHAHSENPNWSGGVYVKSLPSDLPSNYYDLIYCIEVIEHLIDDWYEPTFDELLRLLKPGGTLILSTPLCENLNISMIFCPFCQTEYHPVQHVRSIEPQELKQELERVGLIVDFCQGVKLDHFQFTPILPIWYAMSLHDLYTYLKIYVQKATAKFFKTIYSLNYIRKLADKDNQPHLLAIARKPHG